MSMPGRGKPPLRQLIEADLPVRLSIRIARLARAIEAEFKGIEEVRNRLVSKYGAEISPGRRQVKPECSADFMREWVEVLAQEFPIARDPVRISDEEMAGLKLSPLVILNLDPAIAFGDPDAKPEPAAPAAE